jgi:hypothetical protein
METIRSAGELAHLLSEHPKADTLMLSPPESGSWHLSDGFLAHSESDYFRIGAYLDHSGKCHYRIKQDDGAEIVLIFRDGPNGREFLLQARAEPGLHRGAVWTATVQSTWQNLRSEHGGAAPAYKDVAQSPEKYGRLLHQSDQWDWLDLYDRKKKRFSLIESSADLEESPIHFWATEQAVKEAGSSEFQLSTDLMVSLALLASLKHTCETWASFSTADCPMNDPLNPAPTERIGLDSLVLPRHSSGIRALGKDDYGRSIVFVQFSSRTREVFSWIQPLLVDPNPCRVDKITRYSSRELGELEEVPEPQVSPGNLGLKPISTSAEGGRFFRKRVDLYPDVFGEFQAGALSHPAADGDRFRVDEAAHRATHDLTTTVELRLALFAEWTLQNGE